MAKTGDIKIEIDPYNNYYIFDIIDFINAFEEESWSLNDHGNISYLPLHDDDNYDWKIKPISFRREIIPLLKEKQKCNETIGVNFYSNKYNTGFSLLVYNNYNTINFILYNNVKRIEELSITDFSWYIKKIIPILNRLDINYEYISCSEG